MVLSLATALPEPVAPAKKVCPVCKADFEAHRADKIYCSKRCKGLHSGRRWFSENREKHIAQMREQRRLHPELNRAHGAKYRSVPANKRKMNARQRRLSTEKRQWIRDTKASLRCAKCGEARPMCLDFHHVDGSKKERGIATMSLASKERILKEMAKCIVLCRNCHAEEHWNRSHG